MKRSNENLSNKIARIQRFSLYVIDGHEWKSDHMRGLSACILGMMLARFADFDDKESMDTCNHCVGYLLNRRVKDETTSYIMFTTWRRSKKRVIWFRPCVSQIEFRHWTKRRLMGKKIYTFTESSTVSDVYEQLKELRTVRN